MHVTTSEAIRASATIGERFSDLIVEALFNYMERRGYLQDMSQQIAKQHSATQHKQTKQLLGVTELAKMLKVPPSWIYQQTSKGAGAIPFMKVGKYLRFDPEEILVFFKKRPPHTTT